MVQFGRFIQKTLLASPVSKVLYIAPFRSLAFEVEDSLVKVLASSGIPISQLYGGGHFGSLDALAAQDARVLIATPEKAKALLRSDDALLNDIALVVMDEGHLLGPEKRNVINEMFYEELRGRISENGGKFLLLSAVLPNASDLARWLTGSEETVFADDWRPSNERLGILQWTGTHVNLNWENTDEAARPSFNPRFVTREQIPLKKGQRKQRHFPDNLQEAVVATAYRLKSFGPVLIFIGKKPSVFTTARAYLNCLGEDAEDFQWKNLADWKIFELACREVYGDDNEWLKFARKGILCHHGDLQKDVRLPIEKLMRNERPLVIISTSTLGQGVNLGVSTVIFHSLEQDRTPLTKRDFWNIAGRAGRAFIDNEGKILVALDIVNPGVSSAVHNRYVTRKTAEIRAYFDKSQMDIAKSGVLLSIQKLNAVATRNGVDFDTLLQLISENHISELSGDITDALEVFDWIDDTLLALHAHNQSETEIDNVSWVETFFRKSLGFIQATQNSPTESEQLIDFFKSRLDQIIHRVGSDREKWAEIVKSGLPLSSNSTIDSLMDAIQTAVTVYRESQREAEDRVQLLATIETLCFDLPVVRHESSHQNVENLDDIRREWLCGRTVSQYSSAREVKVISGFYAFTMPWVLYAITSKLKSAEMDDEAAILEELSLMTEVGVPSVTAVKVYQAGIRSRKCAIELTAFFEDFLTISSRDIRRDLVSQQAYYRSIVSEETQEWISLLIRETGVKPYTIHRIEPFEFGTVHEKTNVLTAHTVRGSQYLMSPNLGVVKKINNRAGVDFSEVSNIPGVFMVYNDNAAEWRMVVDNPHVNVLED